MSNNTTSEFIPVKGYKNVFYNPRIEISNCDKIKRKMPPSPIKIQSPNNKDSVFKEKHSNIEIVSKIDRNRLNSKNRQFEFKSESPNYIKQSDISIKQMSDFVESKEYLYEDIKYKLREVIGYGSEEQKINLIDNIIKLFIKENITIDSLCFFLESL